MQNPLILTFFRFFVKGTPLKNPPCTVGCVVEPVLHTVRAGTPDERTCFVELWDIGGSQCHANTRRIFYSNFDGIILVHDLTNRKTGERLSDWLTEVLDSSSSSTASGFGPTSVTVLPNITSSNYFSINSKKVEFDREQFSTPRTLKPILIVGTKLDQIAPPSSYAVDLNASSQIPMTPGGKTNLDSSSFFYNSRRSTSTTTPLATELGAEEIFVNCLTPLSSSMNSRLKVEKFFDKIFTPFYANTVNNHNLRLTSLYERKRV
uniref:Rab-like protein 3 n=1 Tax=Romanomermis culicivorax TaxID=13658 RepID=A0A915IB91_ROMCU